MPSGLGERGQAAGGQGLLWRTVFLCRFVTLMMAVGLLALLSTDGGSAELQIDRNGERGVVGVQHVVVVLNKSRTISLDRAFATTMVGSADIIDVLPLSDHSLYIQGKKVGTTNLSVVDDMSKLVRVIDVEVVIDTANLQEKIRASTGIRGVRVSSNNGQVVLSGQAPDAVAADPAVMLAKSLSPTGVCQRDEHRG